MLSLKKQSLNLLMLGVCCAPIATLSAKTTLEGQNIKLCGADTEWPPYTYYERENNKKTTHLLGFTIELLQKIFAKNAIPFQIDLIPWSRCQSQVAKNDYYQIAINASYSDQRNQDYLLLKPSYITHSDYFYSKKHHPNGLDIKSLRDFKKYNVCGIRGYNYTTYGFDPSEIHGNFPGFPQLIEKIHQGDCDLFIEKYEILLGSNLTGEKYLQDPDLNYAAVPEVSPTPFHMMLSRKYPFKQELKTLIEAEITAMESSGELDTLLKQYTP